MEPKIRRNREQDNGARVEIETYARKIKADVRTNQNTKQKRNLPFNQVNP
jgi:hypothetical protein